MLAKLREEIDAIDKEMLALFERRMDLAKKVGAYKKARNLPVLVPEREQALLKNRLSLLKNQEYAGITTQFFSNLMSLSRHLQQQDMPTEAQFSPSIQSPRVAYLGRPGSNSAEALSHLFPQAAESLAAPSFDSIFALLNEGKADYGILPIENTSTGAINDVLDLLNRNNLFIVGETVLKIRHTLAACPGATLSDIRTVYSHPQAFLQCAEFLKTLPNAESEPMASTADSGAFVANAKDKSLAAIVNPAAVSLFGLSPLATDIQDTGTNTTRFIAISRQMEQRPGADKISLAFTLRHESGALCQVLSAFARHGLNLLYIESRPLPGRNFEYLFFTDLSGSLSGTAEQAAMSEIQKLSSSLQILGNYPAAKE